MFSEIDLSLKVLAHSGNPKRSSYDGVQVDLGLYEFSLMPFVIPDTSDDFRYMINGLLGEYREEFVLVFLVVVSIYLQAHKDHTKNLRESSVKALRALNICYELII